MRSTSLLLTFASVAVLFSGCGDKSPTAPSPPSAPPAAPTYSLSGAVFEMMPGGLTPVEGVAVQVGNAANRATTDQNGFYSISGLPAMTSNLSASRSGYTTYTRGVTIAGDTQLNIEIVRVPRYVLSGIVSKSTTAGDAPFEGLEIYCDGCGEFGHTAVTTGRDGFYSFPWVYAGVQQLQLSTRDYFDPNAKALSNIMVSEVTVRGDTQFNIRLVPR